MWPYPVDDRDRRRGFLNEFFICRSFAVGDDLCEGLCSSLLTHSRETYRKAT